MKTFNYLNKENRPWGAFYVIHDEKNYKLKRLEVYSKQRLSYQYHSKRAEVWTCIQGKLSVILDDVLQPLHNAMFVESNPSPVKYAAKQLRLCDDSVRLPLVKVTEQTKEIINKALKSAKLV